MRRVVVAVALTVLVVGVGHVSADKKPTGPLSEARTRLNRGNYAEARAAYDKLLGDPAHGPAAAVGIAAAWRYEGEYAKALDALGEALKKAPNNPDLFAARGDLFFELGRWDDAIRDADAALKLAPDHFLARWIHARVTRDKGDLTAADQQVRWFVRAYTAASNADKEITDPEMLLIVGQAGTENARWNNISNQFRFILKDLYTDDILKKAEPDCWRAEFYAGMMLLEKFNRPDAIAAFDAALKINPNAAEPLVGKGLASLIKYEFKDAEQFADQALKLNPRLPMARRLKADVMFMGGDLAAAEKELLAAKAVNPRDVVTLGKLAAIYLVQRKTAAFEEIEKTVAAFDSKPGVFYHELAEYLEDRKLYTKAETYFQKAAELRPKLPAARTALGMLFMRMGKEAEGKAILDQAFKADPFNVRVANMRKVVDHLTNYATIKTPHYEVKYDAKNDKVLALFIADYLEEIHAQFQKQYNFEPSQLVPIEVFSRHDMFSGRTIGLPDLHTVGACTGRVVAMASPKAQGLRKPFNWGRVIRHEVTHIFNLTQTDYQCPHWLTEGLAVLSEKMDRPLPWMQALRNRAEANDLFTLDTVLMGFVRPRGPDEWALAYCQSQLYVEYLIKTHGEGSVGKLLNAYREGLDNTDALKQACGVDKSAFEKGYRAYVDEVLKPYRTVGKPMKKPDEKPLTFDELKEAYEKDPDDSEIATKYAEVLLRRGKAAETRKITDAILAKKPGHLGASLVKARLLMRAGDTDSATTVLEEAMKDSPNDPRLLLLVGAFYAEGEQYEKAAELLEKGRKLAPLDGDWLEQLVRVYTASKQQAKLMGVLKELVSRDPDELEGRLKLAKLAIEEKKFDLAEEYSRDALMIDVTNEDARSLYLEALSQQKKEERREKVAKWFKE